MSTSRWRREDIGCIRDELQRLVQEEEFINEALKAVRLARKKNSIELMEVMSKIKELKKSSSKNKDQPKNSKKTSNITTVVQHTFDQTHSTGLEDIDNPSIVNQTQLNLSIGQNTNNDEEEESEESD
jgi:hypothetical protein